MPMRNLRIHRELAYFFLSSMCNLTTCGSPGIMSGSYATICASMFFLGWLLIPILIAALTGLLK
jgi:hypothetical protein